MIMGCQVTGFGSEGTIRGCKGHGIWDRGDQLWDGGSYGPGDNFVVERVGPCLWSDPPKGSEAVASVWGGCLWDTVR